MNLKKHGISFEEAASVFNDMLAVTFPDEDHSENEYREITIGFSNNNRIILVFSTFRENKIRIISAREATKKERIKYEESIL